MSYRYLEMASSASAPAAARHVTATGKTHVSIPYSRSVTHASPTTAAITSSLLTATTVGISGPRSANQKSSSNPDKRQG